MGEAVTWKKVLVEQCSPYYWAISYKRLITLIGHTMYQIVGFNLGSKYFCAGLGRVDWRRRKNGRSEAIKGSAQNLKQPIRMRTIYTKPVDSFHKESSN